MKKNSRSMIWGIVVCLAVSCFAGIPAYADASGSNTGCVDQDGNPVPAIYYLSDPERNITIRRLNDGQTVQLGKWQNVNINLGLKNEIELRLENCRENSEEVFSTNSVFGDTVFEGASGTIFAAVEKSADFWQENLPDEWKDYVQDVEVYYNYSDSPSNAVGSAVPGGTGIILVGSTFPTTVTHCLTHEFTHVMQRKLQVAIEGSDPGIIEGLADTFSCLCERNWVVDTSPITNNPNQIRDASDPQKYGYAAALSDNTSQCAESSPDYQKATVISHLCFSMYDSGLYSWEELTAVWMNAFVNLPTACSYMDLYQELMSAADQLRCSDQQKKVITDSAEAAEIIQIPLIMKDFEQPVETVITEENGDVVHDLTSIGSGLVYLGRDDLDGDGQEETIEISLDEDHNFTVAVLDESQNAAVGTGTVTSYSVMVPDITLNIDPSCMGTNDGYIRFFLFDSGEGRRIGIETYHVSNLFAAETVVKTVVLQYNGEANGFEEAVTADFSGSDLSMAVLDKVGKEWEKMVQCGAEEVVRDSSKMAILDGSSALSDHVNGKSHLLDIQIEFLTDKEEFSSFPGKNAETLPGVRITFS